MGWEGASRGRGHIYHVYTYGCFVLMDGRAYVYLCRRWCSWMVETNMILHVNYSPIKQTNHV